MALHIGFPCVVVCLFAAVDRWGQTNAYIQLARRSFRLLQIWLPFHRVSRGVTINWPCVRCRLRPLSLFQKVKKDDGDGGRREEGRKGRLIKREERNERDRSRPQHTHFSTYTLPQLILSLSSTKESLLFLELINYVFSSKTKI